MLALILLIYLQQITPQSSPWETDSLIASILTIFLPMFDVLYTTWTQFTGQDITNPTIFI